MRRRVPWVRALLALALVGADAAGAAIPAGAAARPAVRPDVPVTSVNLANQLSQNSPLLAADPTNHRFVVVASRVDGPSDFDCQLEVSGDGGRSWLPARPVPQLPPGAEHCYAPEVAFDRTGRLYYLFVGLAGPGNAPMGAFLISSTDRGRTFTAPHQVLGPRNYAVRMVIDPTVGRQGRIHLVWLAPSGEPGIGSLPLTPNPILAAHSDDGGRTFSAPITVSDPQRPLAVAPVIALGADHRVHVGYYDLRDDRRDYQGLDGPTWDGDWSIVVSTSIDGGLHFGPGVVVNDHVVPPQRVMLIFTMPPPSLVTGPKGALYAGWWDARNGDWDIFVAASRDEGRTWSAPVRVNDDPVGNGRDQYMPRLSVAPNGRVDVIFYDRRDDPEDLRNTVRYAASTDGGRHFGANVQLSSESFYSVNGTRYPIPSAAGLVEFGGRIGLVSADRQVLAAWTDTRLGQKGLEEQDVYATEVDWPGGSGGGTRTLVIVALGLAAAGGVAALAVAVAGLVRRRRRRGRRRDATAGLMAAGLLALAGCGGSSGAPLPPPANRFDVGMTEYAYEHPAQAPPGRVVFDVTNRGKLHHELTFVRLPEGSPSLYDQFHGGAPEVLDTVVIFFDKPPGGSGTFAVDLQPGRYGFICFLKDPDGIQHAAKGMTSEFTVQ